MESNAFFGIVSHTLPPELYPLIIAHFDILSILKFFRVSKGCRDYLLKSIDLYGFIVDHYARKGLLFEGMEKLGIFNRDMPRYVRSLTVKHWNFMHSIYTDRYKKLLHDNHAFGSDNELVMFNTMVMTCIIKLVRYDEVCALFVSSKVTEMLFNENYILHPRINPELIFPVKIEHTRLSYYQETLVIAYDKELFTVTYVSVKSFITFSEYEILRRRYKKDTVLVLVSTDLCRLFNETDKGSRYMLVQYWLRKWRYIPYVYEKFLTEFRKALRDFREFFIDKPADDTIMYFNLIDNKFLFCK